MLPPAILPSGGLWRISVSPLSEKANGVDILTDDQGRFHVNELSPGKYKLTLLLPDELYTSKPEQELTVSDGGCATADYYVVDNGRLSGRVLDSEGQPAVKVQLQLMEADHTDPLKDQAKYAQTDAEGRYKFDSLPPGQYVLGANLKRLWDMSDPTNIYPRTFYPGVPDMSKTEFINIGTGEALRDVDWKLPVGRAPSTLTGKVVWDDGTPVARALIIFREVTDHAAPLMNEMAQLAQLMINAQGSVGTDDSGSFTIKGYVGQIYVMAAISQQPSSVDPRRTDQARPPDPVRIVLAKPSESVNIVITKLR